MNHNTSRLSRLAFWSIVLMSFFMVNTAFADTVDAATMLTNFSLNVPSLMRLVTAVGYVMGMFLVFRGVMELKLYGESRTMMSQQHGLSTPLLLLFSGACLLYLPSTVDVGMHTFWKHPTNPYAYLTSASTSQWSTIVTAVYLVVGLIGTISIIRGILQLSQLRSQGGQQVTLGRALTHIIGGIFCVNLYQFLAVLNYTFGLSQ